MNLFFITNKEKFSLDEKIYNYITSMEQICLV